jgi:murein DD-endopeptidase MepM/ murein hydrolase activator NlpD
MLMTVPSHSAPEKTSAKHSGLSQKQTELVPSWLTDSSSDFGSPKVEIPKLVTTLPLELRSQTGQLVATLPLTLTQSKTKAQQLSDLSSEASISESDVAKQPTQKAAKVVQALQVNRLIRQLKASKITPSTVALAFKLDAQEAALVKQRWLVDRLKQKSNRWQDSLAELGFEEWQQVFTLDTNREQIGTSLASGAGLQPVVSLLAFNPQLTISDLTPSSATGETMPYVLEAIPKNRRTPLGAIQKAANLSKIVVDRPMVLVPVQAIGYQVKAGDTLSAIAHQYKLPLSTLIAANQLANPNFIQVNQRLIVPISSAKGMDRSIATATEITAYSGMGGNISDDDSVVETNPENVAEIQNQQSAAAEQAQLSDRYVQNLRTDIEKLQQRYRTQPLLSQAVPGDNPATNTYSGDRDLRKLPQNLPAERAANQNLNAKQADKTLQIEAQKQPRRSVKAYKTEDESGDSLATAPIGRDATNSLQSIQERNVSPTLPPLGSVDTYLPKPTVSGKGFMWPARGKLSSVYGWRWGRMHRGIDIAAPIGTPIYAAAAGTVIKSGWNSGGYGNMVDVKHADGTITRYAHNKRLLVHKGQVVYQGQQISEMGSTGFSTGSHLHFEVRPLGKKAVNPIAFLPR